MTDWRQFLADKKPWCLTEGDCTAVLPLLPDACLDSVVCDPPYPEVSRPYGRLSVREWFRLMKAVVPECMRALKPTGSAVFILQPNSERVGRMRTWLWDFMGWAGRRWGIVQDAWWWNHAALPEAHAIQGRLLRCSLKACVWLGLPNCYRSQEAVLWSESNANVALRASARLGRSESPSGQSVTAKTISGAAVRRGGVTPFNVLPIANTNSNSSAGANGHGAGTPLPLCSWWVRYLTPAGGLVCDPFAGSATVGVAALKSGRRFLGCERMPEYVVIARRRLLNAGLTKDETYEGPGAELPLFDAAGATG